MDGRTTELADNWTGGQFRTFRSVLFVLLIDAGTMPCIDYCCLLAVLTKTQTEWPEWPGRPNGQLPAAQNLARIQPGPGPGPPLFVCIH